MHPLAGTRDIPFQRLAEERFVSREQGSGTHSTVELFFETSGLEFKAVMEMIKKEAIKQAVEAGLGFRCAHRARRAAFVGLHGFPLWRQWQGKRKNPSVAFAQFVLREGVARLGG